MLNLLLLPSHTSLPDAKIWMYLVYTKYWTLNCMFLMVYPKVLLPPNFSIKAHSPSSLELTTHESDRGSYLLGFKKWTLALHSSGQTMIRLVACSLPECRPGAEASSRDLCRQAGARLLHVQGGSRQRSGSKSKTTKGA